MRVCVSGYYGSENIGDELLLQATMRGVKDVLGVDTEFCAIGARPAQMKELHGLQKTARNTGWQDVSKLSNPPKAQAQALEIIRESDLYVMGGGGLLGHDCVYTFDEVRFAKQHGIPVVALGVGGDPFTPKHKGLFEAYFTNVDAITVRDHWSYSNVSNVIDPSKTILEECADPVFTLPVDSRIDRKSNRVLLVMTTIFRWGQKDSSEQQSLIRQWAETLSKTASEAGIELVLYPFSPDCPWHDDRERAVAFEQLTPEPIRIIESGGIPFSDVPQQFSDCLAVIGDRYHSLILSALNGNPFLGIANDTKQRNVSIQLNQPWLYPDNREGRYNIEAAFRDLTQNLGRHRTHLLTSLPEIRDRAERSFQVLHRLS